MTSSTVSRNPFDKPALRRNSLAEQLRGGRAIPDGWKGGSFCPPSRPACGRDRGPKHRRVRARSDRTTFSINPFSTPSELREKGKRASKKACKPGSVPRG